MIVIRVPGSGSFPNRTVLENVSFVSHVLGVPAAQQRRRAFQVLKWVGLQHRMNAYPLDLSGGEQQRVAIARALVNEPVLLLADEPTGNLDSRTSIEVMGIFQRLNAAGLTIVLVTHETDIAEYATRIVSFRDGRVRGDRPVARRDAAVELAVHDAQAIEEEVA